jgi:hypothetical protein
MTRTTLLASLAAIAVAGAATLARPAAGQAPGPQVPYPEGYRSWTHVKSMVIQPGHELYDAFGGIHHVYANAAALAALRDGRPFADGAVLVFDLLEASASGHAITEGARKVVGVMHRDRTRYAATGGWGFEGFKGDTRERAVTDPVSQCFACHQAQEKTAYVFSAWRK